MKLEPAAVFAVSRMLGGGGAHRICRLGCILAQQIAASHLQEQIILLIPGHVQIIHTYSNSLWSSMGCILIVKETVGCKRHIIA